MKKLFVIAIVLTVTVAAWTEGNTYVVTGQYLHDNGLIQFEKTQKGIKPETTTEAFQLAFFLGYINGVVDAGSWAENQLYSIPADVSFGQICAVVGNYLDAHPEQWNKNGSALIFKALSIAWPLKK